MSIAANHGYQFVRPKVEIRQHLLEDGSFLDIPAEILPIPALKPVQFLHLRHHYMTPSGIKEDLHECESVEAQIDVLANEVAGMKHLVRGFVTNLSTLAKHFDAGHEEIQECLKSLLDSHEGVSKFVNPLLKDTLDISAKFDALEKKVNLLHASGASWAQPPPKIIRPVGRRGLKNPPMSARERAVHRDRFTDHHMDLCTFNTVESTNNMLTENAQLNELLTPPSLPQQPPAEKARTRGGKEKSTRKGKGKEKKQRVLEPRVDVKLEKLADSLVAMREIMMRASMKTEEEVMRMRHVQAHDKRRTEELWAFHDQVERLTFSRGKEAGVTKDRIAVYERWADKCLKEQGLDDAAGPGATLPTPEASQPVSDDGAPSTSGQSEATEPTDAVAAASQSFHSTMTASEDVYAVTLNIKCDKKLEELTREEAIVMLKALPLRIHFAPCGNLAGDVDRADEVEDAPSVTVEQLGRTNPSTLISVAGPSETNTAAPVSEADSSMSTSASDAAQLPAPTKLKKSKAKVQSRKRGRASEDADSPEADPRPAAGGSPVKRARV